jgi:hypothetical protein
MSAEAQPTTHTTPLPPPAQMMQMITGFWVSQAIYIAAKLRLADLVKDQPRTAAQLAQATATHAPSLYRLLRALASVGVFVEDDQQRFALTPLAETLRSDVPGSLRAFAQSELGSEHFAAWGNLMHSVRTGEIAFDDHYRQNVWQYYAEHPEDAQTFNESMSGLTQMFNQAVLAAYDFSGINKLVDVAGGTGGLLSAILPKYPALQGVLFDLPHVIAEAGPLLDSAGVRGRCELTSGDFFKAVPAGGDAYILKFIIHDWDDERAAAILRNVHSAMADDGKLLLAETVVAPPNQPDLSKFMDLNMLVMTGGRERTAKEFEQLLAQAGFKLTRIVPTPSPIHLIEGAKIR